MIFFLKLFFFFLPSQLGYHIFKITPLIYGFSIDYLVPTLYLTDVLVLLAFLLLVLSGKLKIRISVPIILFVMIVFLNVLISPYWVASIYKWMKYIEAVFIFYIISRYKPISKSNLNFFLISTLIVAIIALAQFVKGGSLNGILYFLGERKIDLYQPGIAVSNIFKRLTLRPYSIFSHPNSLAGYLVIAMTILLRGRKKTNEKLVLLTGILSFLVLILCWSENAFLSLILSLVILLFFKTKRSVVGATLFALIALSFLPVVIKNMTNINFGDTIADRLKLINASINMIATHPLTGVGVNNFIPLLKERGFDFIYLWELQPVHNLYLLLLSETGLLLGSLIIILLMRLLGKAYDIKDKYLLFSLIFILLSSSLDHYWLTLQQNILLFAVVCGLIF